jgi:hypothetical protein
MAPPEDHGEAATDLQAEFERIFSPVISKSSPVDLDANK